MRLLTVDIMQVTVQYIHAKQLREYSSISDFGKKRSLYL
jgi:hypothetical protein